MVGGVGGGGGESKIEGNLSLISMKETAKHLKDILTGMLQLTNHETHKKLDTK